MQGAFAELWGALGISSGDTLIFKRDLPTGRIELIRHPAIMAVKAEEVSRHPTPTQTASAIVYLQVDSQAALPCCRAPTLRYRIHLDWRGLVGGRHEELARRPLQSRREVRASRAPTPIAGWS
jgi:hypothetical protein